MIVRRAVLVVALALVGALGVTPVAWAHAELQSSSPAQGASLSAAPTQVVLTFGEPVTPATAAPASAAVAPPQAPASAATSDGLPEWGWALGLLVLAAIAAVVVARWRRA